MSTETANQQAQLFEALHVGHDKIVRKRQGNYGVEILSRHCFNPEVVKSVKCIFGFLLDNDGCNEKSQYRCDKCNALCCEFYKDHSQHAEVSSQEQILKQHIAYQSLDQTKQKSKNLDIGSIPTASSVSSDVHNVEYTAVFNAFESSGNYNDGGNDSAAPASQQHAAKKPARNTKSDLLRRYQIVKGHPWNGDSSITAKALKIIVKELEALASGKAASDAASNTAAMEVFKSSKKLPVKSESKSNSKSKSKKKAKRPILIE
jgi:hypothetical protein